jgi:SAM-dependent methyltransferase
MSLKNIDRGCNAYDAWADYYDLAEGSREGIVGFYRSLVPQLGGNLIDLGCGTGLITTAMVRGMRPGRLAVGMDRSMPMLRAARTRSPELDWCAGDIRQPPVTGLFGLVTCCYNTLQLLPGEADVRQALQSVRGLLAPQGLFAFDVFQPNLQRLRIPKRDRFLHSHTDRYGRNVELREDADFDEESSVLTSVWRLVDSLDRAQLGLLRLRFTQYSHPVLKQMLGAAGLRIVEAYGDYDRRPFDAASMRQVLVCAAG